MEGSAKAGGICILYIKQHDHSRVHWCGGFQVGAEDDKKHSSAVLLFHGYTKSALVSSVGQDTCFIVGLPRRPGCGGGINCFRGYHAGTQIARG